MNASELETFAQYIDRIIADTQSKKMEWIRNSPTLFIWRKLANGVMEAQLTLQKITLTEFVKTPTGQQARLTDQYIFTVFDQNGSQRLQLSTQEHPEHRGKNEATLRCCFLQ